MTSETDGLLGRALLWPRAALPRAALAARRSVRQETTVDAPELVRLGRLARRRA